MDVGGVSYHTIRLADDGWAVEVIDQTRLPHLMDIVRLESSADAERASATWRHQTPARLYAPDLLGRDSAASRRARRATRSCG
ncbi:MAG TPA: hypothetical protein VGH86_04015 [Phenylobacterium sp.]|jgi:hypothetical protein